MTLYKAGDKLRVLETTASSRQWGFDAGDVVLVVAVDADDDVYPYQIRKLDATWGADESYWTHGITEFERVNEIGEESEEEEYVYAVVTHRGFTIYSDHVLAFDAARETARSTVVRKKVLRQ